MVILSRGIPRVVAFHVSWYYTWCGISRTQILWYYTWRCPSRNPVACKSMVTRQIFKSHTLTFACDTCKLRRVCEVIVELYCISCNQCKKFVASIRTYVCTFNFINTNADICNFLQLVNDRVNPLISQIFFVSL